jgi:hypothetical protein
VLLQEIACSFAHPSQLERCSAKQHVTSAYEIRHKFLKTFLLTPVFFLRIS